MPRTSVLQGVVGGLAVLSSRAIAANAERVLAPILGDRRDIPRRLAVRALVGAAGVGLTTLPEHDGERLWWSGLRGAGVMLRGVAAGGAIHDVGRALWLRQPSRSWLRTSVASASVLTGLGLWADRRLEQRTAAVQPWPIEQRNGLALSVAVSAGVVGVGRLLGEGVGLSRLGLRRWLGRGAGKEVLADVANLAAWAGLAAAGYSWGVTRLGVGNRTIEATYDQPPDNPRVSGSLASLSAFAELGRQGRRFVTDVLTSDTISTVMNEPAMDPIRIYVGLDSEPLYPTGRAEQALEELERTRAYERRHLLLVSPTGTGWVDQTLVESAELFTRGDVATCAIQYGAFPSFLAVQNVALGRSQFRILLLGVRERLRGMPAEHRPRVLVFGESMGAWTSSDVIMHQGISGFEHYGIDRALWVGMPWLAKWSRSGMIRGSSSLVPPGTVGVFDRIAQLQALPEERRDRLRAVILSHDNDPIAVLGPDLLVQRPRWLQQDQRGRGVPAGMRWTPVVTFLQTTVDALNSMVQVPGKFTSYGHDYRADMARFVHAAFRLPEVTPTQVTAVEGTLVRLDLQRAKRLATGSL